MLADKSLKQIVSYIYGEPLFSGLNSTPIWAYTNTGDIIAGLMVEQATGQPFALLMQHNVLKPLGLDNTFYGIPKQIPQNLARSYTDLFDISGKLNFDGIVDDITDFDVKNTSAFGPSGALFSNGEDVARFTQALFGGELLTKDSLKELVNFVDTGLGFRYGLGVKQIPNTSAFPWGREWLLEGDAFGYSSRTLYLPDDGGYINTVFANREYRFKFGVKSSSPPILLSTNKVLFNRNS